MTLGTVPDAFRLDHRPASAYQTRVSGSCSGNRAISQINASGSVSCRTVSGGAVTRIAAGTDLTGGGSSGTVTLGADENKLQHRVGGTCSSGSAISAIAKSGTVNCQSTNVTQMSGGTSAAGLSNAAPSFIAPVGLSSASLTETEVDTLSSAVQSTAGNLSVKVSAAPGGSASWRFVLVINGGTAVGCTISGSATSCSNTSDRVAVPAGARVALEAIPTGGPTTGVRAMFGWTASG